MGVVTGKTQRLDAPDGSGWIQISALGWLDLDTARTKRLNELAQTMKSFKDLALPSAGEGAKPDPLMMYDRRYLLLHGITEWSYGDPIDVEALDQPTAEWAAREILAFSVPGETEMGKASSRSTDTSAIPSETSLRKNGF
jgi:hypothetical protein